MSVLINDARGTHCYMENKANCEITKHTQMLIQAGIHDPFKINTLDMESYRTQLRSKILANKINASSMAKLKLEDLKAKNQLIDKYRKENGLQISNKECRELYNKVDPTGLEILLKKKVAEKKQNKAAVQIQRLFRGFYCRKWYKKMNVKRTIAALRIQFAFKLYYLAVAKPRKVFKISQDNVKLIQKVCRGYLHRKKIINSLSDQRISDTYAYFKDMRLIIQENSIRFIIYYWRKYVDRMRQKRYEELLN